MGDELIKALAALEQSPQASSINLYLDDGTLNLDAAKSVLEDDEFKSFRDSNPDEVATIKKALGNKKSYDGINLALNVADRINKFGFARGQVREARNMRIPNPSMPRVRGIGAFDSATGNTIARQDMGMTPTQLEQARQSIGRSFDNSRAAITQASRGGGELLSNLQAQSNQQAEMMNQLYAGNAAQQANNQRMALQAAQMQQQRQNVRQQASMFLMRNRDIPLAKYRRTYRDNLMRQGIENTFAVTNNVLEELASARAIIGPRVPGVVRGGQNRYASGQETELGAAINNPILNVETGDALLDQGAMEEIDRYLSSQPTMTGPGNLNRLGL
jgi:hypothetical protein